MGALVAGVSLSTFPYALDVTAKVTSLRDFFITLFFVTLGMQIPLPTSATLSLAAVIVAFTIVSRFVTVTPTLYLMKQGLRTAILPALNLAQISEFTLVLIQVGVQSNQASVATASAASFAFVILAVLSTFAMANSDPIVRRSVALLKRVGIADLDSKAGDGDDAGGHGARRILLLGFYRTASSFISELEQRKATLLEHIGVIDFNPTVFHSLKTHQVKVFYGDIANPDTLAHAGVDKAEIVISTIPDVLLKGTNNEKLVRYVRSVNPKAQVIATAEVLRQADDLYAAGADYVLMARLVEANELIEAVIAAEEGLLPDMRANLEPRLRDRREVLP